ncbi:pyridoxal kinase-like [Homalodisca vitripennis]|uniref:Pyridoxal kinase n=1 Tax=Homalodisca liturata TaxID=320908 RepID=A0A1B6II95_9HEMI|nr:pyridoxal kinase-like [Homalodisca vitripennis]
MMEARPSKVLSIQGHVVSACDIAAYTLQILGIEVCSLHSAQVSSPISQPGWKGQVLHQKELEELMGGLAAKSLDRDFTHLLTGYIGSSSFLNHIPELIRQLRQHNSNLVFVCDPVLGDNGRMCVPESYVDIYRDYIIPLADIVTPNQYEAELLTGKPILDADDAWTVIDNIHSMGCPSVFLSSAHLGYDDYLLGFASRVSGKKKTTATLKCPLVHTSFTGTGELYAALVLAWMSRTGDDVVATLEHTTATVQAVLNRTSQSATGKNGEGAGKKGPYHLKLIQSKSDIEEPNIIVKCKSSLDSDVDWQ